ncbi:MAG: hypothetical protein ACJAQ3_001857, partial [Planctomycetota bacterium]
MGPLAQEASKVPEVAAEDGRSLRIEPAELTIEVGESAQINAQALDANGEPEDAELMFFSRSRRELTVDRAEGVVTGLKPGTYEVIIRERQQSAGENQEGRASVNARLSGTVKVTVKALPLERIEMSAPDAGLWVGTSVAMGASGFDNSGGERDKLDATWSSSDPSVASFDGFGELTLHTAGTFTASVEAEGMALSQELTVQANPIVRMEVVPDITAPRT